MTVNFNKKQEQWLYNHKVKEKQKLMDQLHNQVKDMPFVAFLELTKSLLDKIGIHPVQYNRADPIGTVDIRGELHLHGLIKEELYISLFHEPINERETMEDILFLVEEEKRKGIVITTQIFSEQVRSLANLANGQVQLVDGIHFVDLLIRYGIGFAEKQTTVYVLDEMEL